MALLCASSTKSDFLRMSLHASRSLLSPSIRLRSSPVAARALLRDCQATCNLLSCCLTLRLACRDLKTFSFVLITRSAGNLA